MKRDQLVSRIAEGKLASFFDRLRANGNRRQLRRVLLEQGPKNTIARGLNAARRELLVRRAPCVSEDLMVLLHNRT